MLKKIALAAGALLFAANLMAATPASAKAPHVLLDTSFGKIEIELDPVKAPIQHHFPPRDSRFYGARRRFYGPDGAKANPRPDQE